MNPTWPPNHVTPNFQFSLLRVSFCICRVHPMHPLLLPIPPHTHSSSYYLWAPCLHFHEKRYLLQYYVFIFVLSIFERLFIVNLFCLISLSTFKVEWHITVRISPFDQPLYESLLRPRSHLPRWPWGLQNLRPLAIFGRPQYFHGHTM